MVKHFNMHGPIHQNKTVSNVKTKSMWSQLSCKRPPLGHDKVVAYGRWSLTRKINKISLILDWLINYKKNITLAAKIRQIETNLFDVFTSIHSSNETLYNILEQITVTIPVYLQI